MGRRSKKVKKSDEPVIEKRGPNDPNAENGNKDHHSSSCFINFLSTKLLRDSEGVGGVGGGPTQRSHHDNKSDWKKGGGGRGQRGMARDKRVGTNQRNGNIPTKFHATTHKPPRRKREQGKLEANLKKNSFCVFLKATEMGVGWMGVDWDSVV